MMMQCPRCSTRWRVAAASPVDNPLFKCGRCHNLFRQFPGAPPPAESAATSSRRSAAPPPEPDTLEFIFPDRQASEILITEEPVPAPRAASSDITEVVAVPPPPPPIVAALPIEAPAAPRSTAAHDERAAMHDDLALDTDELAMDSEEHRLDGDELELDIDDDLEDEGDDVLADDLLAEPADDDDAPVLGDLDEDDDAEETSAASGRRVRVEDTMRPPSGFGTIMQSIGLAVAGFGALAMVVRVAPEQTSAWLSRLPVAGAGFAHDHNLARKVELRNVHGRFQRLRNARRVFVISGDARNNSPLTIERIEVSGALYGLGGGELDQKVVTTGNRTALSDLSEAEIVLLQRLDPAIALAPGETTPFLIVFLEPPRELREFSSRVLTVRPTRRASSPPLHPPGSAPGSVG